MIRVVLIVFLLCGLFLQPSYGVEDELFELSLFELNNLEVTTASRVPEKLVDTPVAVTVITADMIAHSGATSLKRLLVTYVPGFTAVEDQNEINVAARGIYTSSQQKILFLLNGHRLNSHSYSMAAPDFSLSLDKIQQVEVLRGPASALYGNVALTAVVNIILKTGAEHEGSSATISQGDHGVQLLSYQFGQSSQFGDLYVWANHYQAEGETQKLNANQVYAAAPAQSNDVILGGVRDKSSYDLGLSVNAKSWSLLMNARRSHYIEPFHAGGVSGEPYDYDAIDLVEGYGPGYGYEAEHVRGTYDIPFMTHWNYRIEAAVDHFMTKSSVVTNPSASGFAYVGWSDVAYSMMHLVSGETVWGDVQLGLQYDTYRVFDDELRVGSGGKITADVGGLMDPGKETIVSLFGQHKYEWTTRWLTNFGFRYDKKDRAVTRDVTAFSPRLALIYKQTDWSVKLSYAESFVDSTYWNRFSNLGSFRGASELDPERLKTYQISPSFYFPDLALQYHGTVFYNQADDFIRRDLSAAATEPNFSNAGELTSVGIEQELMGVYGKLTWRANMTWQEVLNYENFSVEDGEIANVPSLTVNGIFDYAWSSQWHTHLTVQHVGEQYSPINVQSNGVAINDPFPNEGVTFQDPNHRVKDVTLFHLQVSYEPIDDMRIDLAMENVLDEQYQQGGTTLHPYPQTGRWTRLGIQYDF